MKVSILVPVYAVEDYIERCAISLFEQDYEDIEYIFVNDCTPDRSIQILEELIKRYPHREAQVQIVHHEEHRGVLATRKTAIKQATGAYIQWVDSDDWVEQEMISFLVKKAQETGADIIGSDYFQSDYGLELYIDQEYSEHIEDCLRRLLISNNFNPDNIHSSLCFKFVARALYTDEVFPEQDILFREDLYISLQLFLKAKSITHLRRPAYHYWNNKNSINASKDLKHWQSQKLLLALIKEALDKHQKSDLFQLAQTSTLELIFNDADKYKQNPLPIIKAVFPNENVKEYLRRSFHWGRSKQIFYTLYLYHLGFLVKPLVGVTEFILNLSKGKPKRAKYRPVGPRYREQAVEPWVFLRVYNEITTLKACLDSIQPVLKKGVIAYHKLREGDEDDGSIAYIKQFVKENPGFIVYEYPEVVYPGSDAHYKGDFASIPKAKRINTYYQKVFELIPNGEWFMKIDADHIWDTEKLREALYLPQNDDEFISFPFLNVHYQDGEVYSIKDEPFGVRTVAAEGDHWLVKKRPEHYFYFKSFTSYKTGIFNAYELFNWKKVGNLTVVETDVINWHFKFMKAWRAKKKLDIKLEVLDKGKLLKEFSEFSFADNILDRDYLLKICKKYFT